MSYPLGESTLDKQTPTLKWLYYVQYYALPHLWFVVVRSLTIVSCLSPLASSSLAS